MHTRRFKILTVLVVLLFINCCIKTKTYISPNESLKIRDLKKAIVKLKDGTEWKLRDVHMEGNKLVGYAKDSVKKEIEISLIESVRTEKTNYTFAILVGGTLIIAAILIHGVATAPEPPPSEWN